MYVHIIIFVNSAYVMYYVLQIMCVYVKIHLPVVNVWYSMFQLGEEFRPYQKGKTDQLVFACY